MKIKLEHVTKSFKGIEIIRDVSTTFESGNIYGLIGKNGSGKSVFLKMLCGFYFPTSGSIYYNDDKLDVKNDFPKNTRALIENPDFIPELTGYENLKLLADIQNKIGDTQIFEALKVVNLYDEKDKKYSKYSLGMKQKLGIAQVIMEDPEVMIFDEPLNGIESDTAIKLRKFFIEKKKAGKLIIVASHIKDDINLLCDTVYKFENGKISYEENE